MSRPLLKLGGDSGDILSDVLRLPGVSEAETVISGAEGRDELRHIRMSLQAPGGGLALDRVWALYSEDGRFINGKSSAGIH